ncbi:MAG: hypothetical protein SF097_23005 [Acidobacteriota bacterium]|nr:hypothetical protein [Acidobacteriota bacterium]
MKRLAVIGIIWCLLTGLSGCKSRGASVTEAEQDSVACALLVADTLGDRSEDLLADVARGFAKVGECERALRVADSFKEKEWFRAHPYLALNKANLLADIYLICSRNGNHAIAEKASNLALQVLDRNAKEQYRYNFREGYDFLALNYATLGKDKDAIRLVAEHSLFPDKEEKDISFTHRATSWIRIAKKLDVAGNRKGGLELIKMAVASADQIKDTSLHASVLVEAAEALFDLGESNLGIELLEKALLNASQPGESSYRDDTKLSIIEAYTHSGDFKCAENVIALLELEYKRSWAWRDFGIKAAETGDYQLALRVSEKISGFDDKASVLKAIVTRYAEHNDLRKAVEICEQVKGYGNRADARLTVARKYAQNNDTTNAKKFLDLAVEDALSESSGSYNSQWSRHLQTALLMAAVGEKERAISVIKEIGKQAVSSGSLVDAASESAKEGNYDLAIEISSFVTTDNPCDHCWIVTKENYKAQILIDALLKHADAKRKGLDLDKNVPLAVLKSLGLKP